MLKQRQAFDVTDGDAVLEEHPRVIGAQRQAMLGRNARNEHFHASAKIGAKHVSRIAVGEPVQLTIAHGRRFSREVEHPFTLGAAQLFDREWRRRELGGQGYIRAPNQWTSVVEKLTASRQSTIGASGARFAKLPADEYFGLRE